MPAENPLLQTFSVYPFSRLTPARSAAAKAHPDLQIVDFGTGEPREPTPEFIRQALLDAVASETVSQYPLAAGLPEFRTAIADWIDRRFQVKVDPDTQVIPIMGSKELIFSLPLLFAGNEQGRNLVGVPQPAYPVYERGARYAGMEVLELPLLKENNFLPDLEALSDEQWSKLALLWVNYPNNPTAASASVEWLTDAVKLCQKHGVVIASDEAYSELWFEGDPPSSIIQAAQQADSFEGVLAVQSLSKRSSMPGYRCGFVAGDQQLIAMLKRLRPSVGTAPQRFIQQAGIAALNDETHVEQVRERYRQKLQILQPALDHLGLKRAGGQASFFIWLQVNHELLESKWIKSAQNTDLFSEINQILTDGKPSSLSSTVASALLCQGVVAAPGEFFGPAGSGYIRLALVPTIEDCTVAAERLQALIH